MPANIEFKARIRNAQEARRLAEDLSGGVGQLLHQRDTFFQVPQGYLKLRQFDPRRGELIAYERPAETGPKRSEYYVFPTDDPQALETVLAAALGIRGVVSKRRHLFLAGATRIHLDQVEGLGDFVEVEVPLDGDDSGRGRLEADRLMTVLGVGPGDLVAGAYIDLIDPGR